MSYVAKKKKKIIAKVMPYKGICNNQSMLTSGIIFCLFYFIVFWVFLEGWKEGNSFHSSYSFFENDLVLQNYSVGLL